MLYLTESFTERNTDKMDDADGDADTEYFISIAECIEA